MTYREPDETRRCACCRSTELSPITRFEPSEGFARVHMASKRGRHRTEYTIDRAQVCLRCGHVMHFLGAEQLAALARDLPVLDPLGETS